MMDKRRSTPLRKFEKREEDSCAPVSPSIQKRKQSNQESIHPPTNMSLNCHREYVSNVKKFVTNPVPLELGVLKMSMRHRKVVDESAGVFFGSVKTIWELRITDSRVKYQDVGKFTNVPDAASAGGNSTSPTVAELATDRLILVAERRSSGILNGRQLGYAISMADCSKGIQCVQDDPAYNVGKLEVIDSWGLKFSGFDMSARYSTGNNNTVCMKRETLKVTFVCKPGNPRNLRISLPVLDSSCPETEEHFWQNDVPPVLDPITHSLSVHVDKLQSFSLQFHNRQPIWDPLEEAHFLDFAERCTRATIENFQIDSFSERETERPVVQLGCISIDESSPQYNLDVQYPFSILQAMQLALASIEDKFSTFLSCDA